MSKSDKNQKKKKGEKMANKSDFTVGQTVWHTAYPSRDVEIKEGKVTKVGRKYVSVDDRYRFYIDNLVEDTNYGARGKLYLDKQVYEDEVEFTKNIITLRNSFYFGCGVTLEQTRQILKILDGHEKG